MPVTRDPLTDPRFASLDAAGVVELCGSLADYGEAGGLSRELMLQVGTFAEARFGQESEVLLAVARMYENGGEPARALKVLLRAGRTFPDDERVRPLLAKALQKQGDARTVDEALDDAPPLERKKKGADTAPMDEVAKLRAMEDSRPDTIPVMRRVRASEHPPVTNPPGLPPTPASGMPIVPRAARTSREAARTGNAVIARMSGRNTATARAALEEAERATDARTDVGRRSATRERELTPAESSDAPSALRQTGGVPRATRIRLLEPDDERRRLDPYELIGELASGGMATVFLGRLAGAGGFQRFVAIKRLHPHLAREEEFVEMFLDEARIAAGIHHPHVVPILEVGMSDAGYYLVMEFIEGDTLAGLVIRSLQRGTPLPPRIAARIVLDGLAGLHAAHQLTDGSGHYLGLVHRDCTPQNILVGIDGSARITDFGVARAASRLALTAPQRVKGKVAYLSPEQAHALELDRRSDLFTMGIVLWEAIAGRPLFQGETEAATLSRLLAGKVPSLRSFAPDVPAALDEVCRRALAHDRNRRFRTAAEMGEALERAVNAEGFGGMASPRELGRFVEALMGAEIAAQREAVRNWLGASDAGPNSRGPRSLPTSRGPMRSAPILTGTPASPIRGPMSDDAPETPAPMAERSSRLSSMPPPLPEPPPEAKKEAPAEAAAPEGAAAPEDDRASENAAPAAAPAPARSLPALLDQLRTMKVSNRNGALMVAVILAIALAPLAYKAYKQQLRHDKQPAAAASARMPKKKPVIDAPAVPTNGPAWDEWPTGEPSAQPAAE